MKTDIPGRLHTQQDMVKDMVKDIIKDEHNQQQKVIQLDLYAKFTSFTSDNIFKLDGWV